MFIWKEFSRYLKSYLELLTTLIDNRGCLPALSTFVDLFEIDIDPAFFGRDEVRRDGDRDGVGILVKGRFNTRVVRKLGTRNRRYRAICGRFLGDLGKIRYGLRAADCIFSVFRPEIKRTFPFSMIKVPSVPLYPCRLPQQDRFAW